MKISKQRFQQLKKRGRKVVGSVAKGGKSTALEAVVGAVVGFGRSFVESKVSVLGSRPWATPAVCIVGGHLLKRKAKFGTAGAALVGAGGALLGEWYKNRNAAPAATSGAAGLGDAGMVYRLPPAHTTLAAPPVALEEAHEDAGLIMPSNVYAMRTA
jgi:hypothetical protein